MQFLTACGFATPPGMISVYLVSRKPWAPLVCFSPKRKREVSLGEWNNITMERTPTLHMAHEIDPWHHIWPLESNRNNPWAEMGLTSKQWHISQIFWVHYKNNCIVCKRNGFYLTCQIHIILFLRILIAHLQFKFFKGK